MDDHSSKATLDVHEEEILKAYQRTETISVFFFCSFMLLLAVSILLAGLLLKDLQSLLLSTAASLLASLVLTIFFTLIVDRARSQSSSRAQSLEIEGIKKVVSEAIIHSSIDLSKGIENRINKMLDEETTRLADHWPELLPQDYFPPSTSSNPRFLEALGASVEASELYIFRGSTGRYVPSLLEKHGKSDLDCNILIVDPRETEAIRVCAINRHAARSGRKSTKVYEDDIRQEIL